jgi:hypothetical protein
MSAHPLPTRHQKNGKNLAADIIKGSVAGWIGVIALDQVANYLYNHESKEALEREKQARDEIGSSDMGPASMAARKLARLCNLDLNEKQLNTTASVIHYGLGIVPGAAYAALLDRAPKLAIGRGTLYGFTLFAVNDELLSVKLGLAAKPSKYPWQAHFRGFAAHVAMGLATYHALRLLNRIWI